MGKWREWTEKRAEFEAKLKTEFPLLYEGLGVHWRDGGMLNGITVGPGWWDIIYELSKKLETLMVENSGFRIKVVQIKEKFSNMRYYIDSPNYEDNFDAWQKDPANKAVLLIGEAEKETMTTCEYCGAKGATISDYHPWLKTLCAKCHEERKGSGC